MIHAAIALAAFLLGFFAAGLLRMRAGDEDLAAAHLADEVERFIVDQRGQGDAADDDRLNELAEALERFRRRT